MAGLHLWVGRLILIPGGHILLASSGCSTGECAKTPSHCLSENTLRITLSRKLLKKWSWSSFSFINGVKTHYSILFEWNNYTLGLKEEADGEDRGGRRKLRGGTGRGDDCRNRTSLREWCEGIVIFRTFRPHKYTHSSGATGQLSEPFYPSFSRIHCTVALVFSLTLWKHAQKKQQQQKKQKPPQDHPSLFNS